MDNGDFRRVTSRDVAREAGVTQATVSLVLNGKGSISPETRNRVTQVAADLGYRPNLAARSMRTSKSGRLAIVTGIHGYNSADMVKGAAQVAEANGYFLEVHSFSGNTEQQSDQILDLARSGQVEGILCFAELSDGVLRSMPPQVPLIAPENYTDGMHSAGQLADATPVVVLIEHLAALGHQQFLHLAGPGNVATSSARKDAYLATVARLGLTSLGVIASGWDAQFGMDAVASLPPNVTVPLAIIAVNDAVAIGAMRAANLRGWRVPEDVSITGWDNYDVSGFLNPPLTTVNFDRMKAGHREMRRLIALMKGQEIPPEPERLHTVVWRQSTAIPHASE